MYHLYFLLVLARVLRANVSFPRPCECLVPRHSASFQLPCSVGWDRYVVTRAGFDGFDSMPGAPPGPLPPPPSTPAAGPCASKMELWDLMDKGGPAALPTDFCLTLPRRIFGREPGIQQLLKRVVKHAWGCDGERDVVTAVGREQAFGFNAAVLGAVGDMLKRLTGEADPSKARFGAIHIRRDDRRSYYECASVEHAVNVTRFAVDSARAAGESPDAMPWLVFLKGEREFADELRGNLTALGIARVVILEREMHELVEASLLRGADGSSNLDNYFLMRGVHWLVSHAAISIRSSESNDWLWNHGEGLPAEDRDRGHWWKKVWKDGVAGGATQWVYYLCHENENCADWVNIGGRDC